MMITRANMPQMHHLCNNEGSGAHVSAKIRGECAGAPPLKSASEYKPLFHVLVSHSANISKTWQLYERHNLRLCVLAYCTYSIVHLDTQAHGVPSYHTGCKWLFAAKTNTQIDNIINHQSKSNNGLNDLAFYICSTIHLDTQTHGVSSLSNQRYIVLFH